MTTTSGHWCNHCQEHRMFSANQPSAGGIVLVTIFTLGLALLVMVPMFLGLALAGTYTPRCTVCGQKKGSKGPSR